MSLFCVIRISAPRSGCCLCVMHTLVWFPLKSKGCFSVSKLLNEFKGERRKHWQYYFSVLCWMFWNHCLQFYLDERLFRSGRKKEKTTFKFFKFRGRLVIENLRVWTFLRLNLQWEIQLKKIGGTEGTNNVDLRDLNLLIPGVYRSSEDRLRSQGFFPHFIQKQRLT